MLTASAAFASGESVPLNAFDLPAGGSVTVTFQVDVDNPLGVCGSAVSNQGTVVGTNFTSVLTDDPAVGGVADATVTGLDVVDLSIAKSNGAATSIPGNATTYTITVGNAGPSAAVGALVSDTFPADLTGVTWTCAASAGSGCTAAGSGNLGDTVTVLAGGTLTYTVMGTISAGATGTLSNTATVASAANQTECNLADNSATDVDTLTPEGDLSITKDDGQTEAVPGDPVTYTITASNTGPSDAVGATVADTFPASLTAVTWTCSPSAGSGCPASGFGNLSETVTVAVGGSVVFTVDATISPSATGTLVNTATVTAPGGFTDANGANDSSTDTDTLTPMADLAVTKVGDVDFPPVGSSLIYTITVDNLGPSDAANVVVTDTLPAGVTLVSTTGCAEDPAGAPTCSLGAIAAGGMASYTIEVTIDSSPPASITNTATVSSDTPDPVPGNDSDSEDTNLDSTPPGVDNLTTVGDTGDGVLSECETARTSITQMVATFSEGMLDGGPAGAGSVTNAASYLLVSPAAAGSGFDTVDCGGGTGGDQVISIDAVAYDAGTFTATLDVNGGSPLGNTPHRLLLCGSGASPLQDAAGNLLDGGAGTGSDLARTFRVDRFNRFADGHFDDFDPACTLDAWMSSDLSQVELSNEDVDASPISGSAHNVDPFNGFDLGQCVPVGGGEELLLGVAARVDAGPGVTAALEASCELFDQPGCGGTSLGLQVVTTAAQDTALGWLDLEAEIFAPAASVSALCGFAAFSPQGDPFDAYFDDAFLDGLPIFADGFESGDVSAWSSSVP